VVSGGGLGAFYFGYGKAVPSPVRVGVIGTGDEGSVLIGAINPKFLQVVAICDIRPYNVHRAFHGDHYSDAALKARCGLMAKYGWQTEEEARKHVKVYQNYKELLADKNIEAVITALPLHLHAKVAIDAMKAGKHVLTEKLMAHSVHECKEMAQTAKRTKLHLATGHQRHYNILYDNATKMLATGLLGDLHYIRAQWHRGNLPGSDSWQQPVPLDLKPDKGLVGLLDDLIKWKRKLAESTGTSAELWQARVAQKEAQLADAVVQAKEFEYQKPVIKDEAGKEIYSGPELEELIRWRLWNRTGGGLMVELGSHQLDAASIFISAVHGGHKQHPLCVMAAGNRPIFPADRDVDDHVYCIFEFPAPGYDPDSETTRRRKIGVTYSSINGNGFGGHGEVVYGTKGTLILAREQEVMLYRGSASSKIKVTKGDKDKVTLDTQASGDPQSAAVGTQALKDVSRGYTEELEHWAWCIRNPDPRNRPRCHPQVALADAVIALTTNRAIAKGTRIEFQKEWFDPDSKETPEGIPPDLSRYA